MQRNRIWAANRKMSSQNPDEVTQVSPQDEGEGQEVGKERFTAKKQQTVWRRQESLLSSS